MAIPKTKIARFRRQLFLNQSDVAKELRMSVVNYSKIERGERRLTVEVALELVRIFRLNHIEELLENKIAS